MATNSALKGKLRRAKDAVQSGRNDEAIAISTKVIDSFSQQKRKPSEVRGFHVVRLLANTQKDNMGLESFYDFMQAHLLGYDDPATAPPPSDDGTLAIENAEFKPPFDVHPGSLMCKLNEAEDIPPELNIGGYYVPPNLPTRPFSDCNCCCDIHDGNNKARDKARRTIAWLTEGNFSVTFAIWDASETSSTPKLKKKQSAAKTVERFRHDGSSEYNADSDLLLCIRNRSHTNEKGESLYTGTVFCFRAHYNRTLPIEEVETIWHETWMDHVLCSKANATNQKQRESIAHRVLQLFLRHHGLKSLNREIGFLLCCYLLRRLTTPGCCKLVWMEEIAKLLPIAKVYCLAGVAAPVGQHFFSNTESTGAITHVLSPDAIVSRLEPIAREIEGFQEFKDTAVDYSAMTMFSCNLKYLMETLLWSASSVYEQLSKLTTDESLAYEFLNRAGELHRAISYYSYAGMLFWDAWQKQLPHQPPPPVQTIQETGGTAAQQIWTDHIDVTTTLHKLLSVYSCELLGLCSEDATQDTTAETTTLKTSVYCAFFGLLYVSNFHCVPVDDDEIKKGVEMDFLEEMGPSCKEFLKPEYQRAENAQEAILGAMFLEGHIVNFHSSLFTWSTEDTDKLSTCMKQAKHFASHQGVKLEEKKDENIEVAGHPACCRCGSFGKLAGCFLACSRCGAEETLPGCFLICPCGMRCYCCQECQRDDWKQGGHKNSCTTRTKVATVNEKDKKSNDDDDKISNGDTMKNNNDSKNINTSNSKNNEKKKKKKNKKKRN